MEIKTKQLKRVDVVEVQGRVDSSNASQLEDAFKAITGANRFRVVVDMQKLEYMSSRGLRALISLRHETRRWNRGDLRLCNMPARIKEVFELAGLLPLFQVYDSTADAVGSF